MKRVVAWLLVLFPLIGVVDGILEYRRIHRVPSLEEWRQAAKVVRTGYQKGDIVVFVPYWADEGKRFFAGMRIDVAEELDPTELKAFPRVWFVSSMSRLDFELPGEFAPLMKEEFPRIHVILARPKRVKAVFDMIQWISKAKVTRIYGKNPNPCTNFKDGRWYCGPVHDWQFVGVAVRDTAEGPKEVIWAHPLDKGNRIVLEYDNVPGGDFFEFHYGWSLRAIESSAGETIHLKVLWDDKPLLYGVLLKKDHKWNRLTFPLPSAKGLHKLRVEWWTPNFKDRQLLFKGWVFRRTQ